VIGRAGPLVVVHRFSWIFTDGCGKACLPVQGRVPLFFGVHMLHHEGCLACPEYMFSAQKHEASDLDCENGYLLERATACVPAALAAERRQRRSRWLIKPVLTGIR
jgi:hypothetical protein